jgi:tetratricopeptide (TPR) repeat protein
LNQRHVLAVLGAYRRFGRRSSFVFGLGAAVLALLTVMRNSDYRSNEAIWRDTVAKRPQNARAQCSLADALFVADRVDEALPLYAEAIRLKPDYAEAHLNLGSALLARERASEALPELEAAARLQLVGLALATAALGCTIASLTLPWLTFTSRWGASVGGVNRIDTQSPSTASWSCSGSIDNRDCASRVASTSTTAQVQPR